MIVLHALESILSIIIMITLGYILTAKGWFREETSKLFSRLVTIIALPPFMVWNLVSTFDREKLLAVRSGLIIPFLSMLVCFGLSWIIARLIGVDYQRRGTFQTMFFVSNTIFIGLPVNLALFGHDSIPFVLLYYIANTVLFWTIGMYGISQDGDQDCANIISLATVKKIFSPPLLGFLVAVILILVEVKLPAFILDTCRYLGNLTTPLSMLFIGIAINAVKLHQIKINKDMIAIMAGRFIISPVSVILLATIFPIPDLMKKVFVMQAAMPVMTQTSIVAKAYGADAEYAAVMTTVSTLLAAIFIPLYMLILS